MTVADIFAVIAALGVLIGWGDLRHQVSSMRGEVNKLTIAVGMMEERRAVQRG